MTNAVVRAVYPLYTVQSVARVVCCVIVHKTGGLATCERARFVRCWAGKTFAIFWLEGMDGLRIAGSRPAKLLEQGYFGPGKPSSPRAVDA